MREALHKLRDEYMAGLERVNSLQQLLETSGDEPDIQSVMVDLAVCGERIAELTREAERTVQANFGQP